MKLLYAEDEREMSEAVADILTFHNYSVDCVYDGADALAYAENEKYDGIILDIMMPRLSGLEVLARLRGAGCTTPILLLSARSQVEDRIEGLNMGADDYLPKPFAAGELLARVRAMLRRREEFTPDVLRFGSLWLNMQSFEMGCGESAVMLSRLEYKIMELLMLNKGIFFSTEDILSRVWGYDTEAEFGSVWVYISYLRKKLASLDCGVELKAKRGVGYMLEVTE